MGKKEGSPKADARLPQRIPAPNTLLACWLVSAHGRPIEAEGYRGDG